MSKLELLVGGQLYGGWKSATVKRSLTALAGGFTLQITPKWAGQREAWPIGPDDACELRMAGKTVITGFVDSLEMAISPEARTFSISGRDKTADFVDCSADDKQYTNVKLDALARALAKPFGLKVTMNGDAGAPFGMFQVNTGESGFEAIERACRLRGFLLTTDGVGTIVITKPGKSRAVTSLIEGQNILSATAKFNHTDRYSVYSVKGQRYGLQDDLPPDLRYRMEGKAYDPNVKRYRPHVIQAEAALGDADSKKRAQWEATNRAAKSASFTVEIRGWTQADGSLWTPNLLVPVEIPSAGVKGDLLIVSTSMVLSEGGELTSLDLARKDAFQPDTTIQEKADPLEAQIRKDVKK